MLAKICHFVDEMYGKIPQVATYIFILSEKLINVCREIKLTFFQKRLLKDF